MFGGGRPPTVESLIQQHHALLYRYAFRLTHSAHDAEDLTQQTYLIACENLHQLRDPAAAKSWLCTILRHAFLKLRKSHSPAVSLERLAEPWASTEFSQFDEESLQKALGQIPEEYRSAVILYYFQELSYKEIADALEIPLGTVMSRLSRGKSVLKEKLLPHHVESGRMEFADSLP